MHALTTSLQTQCFPTFRELFGLIASKRIEVIVDIYLQEVCGITDIIVIANCLIVYKSINFDELNDFGLAVQRQDLVQQSLGYRFFVTRSIRG